MVTSPGGGNRNLRVSAHDVPLQSHGRGRSLDVRRFNELRQPVFRLNDEANLNILDGEFALRETKNFEDDRRRSKQITLAEWERRPVREKTAEYLAGLLRSQL
jgi:hypothetical protein